MPIRRLWEPVIEPHESGTGAWATMGRCVVQYMRVTNVQTLAQRGAGRGREGGGCARTLGVPRRTYQRRGEREIELAPPLRLRDGDAFRGGEREYGAVVAPERQPLRGAQLNHYVRHLAHPPEHPRRVHELHHRFAARRRRRARHKECCLRRVQGEHLRQSEPAAHQPRKRQPLGRPLGRPLSPAAFRV
eukprot:1194544-Prorocentrum_minimum.AAC.6